MGLIGLWGKERGEAGRPQGLVRIGLGGGAAPPPSFSSLSPFLDSYSYYLEGVGGILLPVGVGLLLGRAIERAGPPPPPLLYIGGGGTPWRHNN